LLEEQQQEFEKKIDVLRSNIEKQKKKKACKKFNELIINIKIAI
jgi:hypothetical protein